MICKRNIYLNIPIFLLGDSKMGIRQARIAITTDCPLKCVYCYSEDQANSSSLSYDEIKDILIQLYNLGTKYVSFTGGEPLLKQDVLFPSILYATSLEMRVTIATQGALLTLDLVQRLKQAGVNRIQISPNSSPNARYVHDGVCREEGNFKKVVKAAEYVVSNGIHLLLRPTVTSINYMHLFDCFVFFSELCSASSGEHIFKLKEVMEEGRTKNRLDLIASQEKTIQGIYEMYEKIIAYPSPLIIHLTLPYRGPLLESGDVSATELTAGKRIIRLPNGNRVLPPYCACSKNEGIITIDAAGNVIPCIFINEPIGNIHEAAIGTLWDRTIRHGANCVRHHELYKTIFNY